MTDRELFEFVAKAAGIPSDWVPKYSHLRSQWNPLTDDGDAFRLQVKLKLFVEFSEDGHEVRCDSYSGHHYTIVVGGSPEAACREAIFNVAVAIGRSMP